MIGARPLEAAAAYAIGTLTSKGRDNVPMASPQLKARTARRVELCLLAIVLLAFGVVIVICGTSAEAADLVGNGAYSVFLGIVERLPRGPARWRDDRIVRHSEAIERTIVDAANVGVQQALAAFSALGRYISTEHSALF